MARTSTGPATNQNNISELTRSKLAGELILPLNQQRRGPCLRKLVHWSNLLSTLTSPTTIARIERQQDDDDRRALSANQAHSENHRSSSLGRSELSREQAEYDWFEHLMEEIDDSDSESESSDGAPDPPTHHHLTEPGLIHIHHSTTTPPPEARARSRRKRASSDEHSDPGPQARRPRLLIRSPGPRRARPPRPCRRDPACLGLPHWGFLCIRPSEEKEGKEKEKGKEVNTTTGEDEDGHLPSLVPIKARYRFESIAHHLPPSLQLPKRISPTPSLDSIDFSPYDFIIAASGQLAGQTVHVKYLVGPAAHAKHSASSFLHSLHHSIQADHPKISLSSSHHPPTDDRSSAARRAPTHPAILVTKLHIVLNNLALPPPPPSSQQHHQEDDGDEHHLGLDPRLAPGSSSGLHQVLFWKVFAIRTPPPF